MMTRCRLPVAFLDTETTGLDPKSDTVIEVAVVAWMRGTYACYSSLVRTEGTRFAWSAMAAHHLRPRDVQRAVPRETVVKDVRDFVSSLGRGVIVAHNASFDSGFLPDLADFEWIDSLRLARHAWPDAESHANFALLHGLDLPDRRMNGESSHRALADAVATAEVFFAALRQLKCTGSDCLPKIRALLATPAPVGVFKYGKHYGRPIAEIPSDYLWFARNNMKHIDSDTMHAVESELSRRHDYPWSGAQGSKASAPA